MKALVFLWVLPSARHTPAITPPVLHRNFPTKVPGTTGVGPYPVFQACSMETATDFQVRQLGEPEEKGGSWLGLVEGFEEL